MLITIYLHPAVTKVMLFVWQDFLSHGSQGLFTQVNFNDRMQDLPSTQSHYGLGGGLQSQVRLPIGKII